MAGVSSVKPVSDEEFKRMLPVLRRATPSWTAQIEARIQTDAERIAALERERDSWKRTAVDRALQRDDLECRGIEIRGLLGRALHKLIHDEAQGWHKGTGYRDWESLTDRTLTCAKVLARADDRDEDAATCTCGLDELIAAIRATGIRPVPPEEG